MSIFDMGEYGLFIWLSYGVSALGIAIAAIWSLRSYASAKAQLKALEDKKP